MAVQTEDHPIDYGDFEGVIPERYGAGIVMLWDYGTWQPQSDDIDTALDKGDLKFTQAEGVVGARSHARSCRYVTEAAGSEVAPDQASRLLVWFD